MIYLIIINGKHYLTKNPNKIDELYEKYGKVDVIEIQEQELMKDVVFIA